MLKPTWAGHARTGPVRTYKQLKFFACEGLIVLHDERLPQEDYNVILPDDFTTRAVELGNLARRCMATNSQKSLREEGKIYLEGAQAMVDTAKEAKDMGDPSDPQVRAFWERHRNKKSRVSLSAGSNPEGYPEFSELPRGKNTGRTAEIDGQAAAAQDARLIHQPPRRKKRLLLDV
jgi:hypothetical protein